MTAILEMLVFSSAWVAAAAGALCAAAALGMGLQPLLPAVAVAVAGTLVVYNVDRLRDLERDRATAPRRSAFVERHYGVLVGICVASLAVAASLVLALGPRAPAVLVPVLVLGLLHRRLKGIAYAYAKAVYITAAWLAVVVGLAAALGPSAARVGWVAAILGPALFANAAASSVRDAEAAAERLGPAPVLWTARISALLGVVLGALAPAPVRPLAAVPLLTLAVLLPFRPDERYGLLVVDGALLVGAVLAIGWLW